MTMSEKDDNKKVSAVKAVSAEQAQETEVTGSWWDRVPEEEKKKYNRAWLYHLYGDLKIKIYDMEAVLK